MDLAFFGLLVELGLQLTDFGQMFGFFCAEFSYIFLEIEGFVL